MYSSKKYIELKTATKKNILLNNVDIDININNHVAQFTLVQSYHNTEIVPTEIFYIFPTPTGASVFNFSAKVGDKLIKTILKEKVQARQDYNNAISEGNGGFLMERVMGDVFNVSLGNVQPDAKIEIIIKYMVELKIEIDASRLRLNIPLTMMPRYVSNINTTQNMIVNGTLVNPEKISEKPYNLSICGNINMPDGIVSIDSKTCGIKLSNMGEKSLKFEINNLENLNEDVIISIKRNIPKSLCLGTSATNLQLTNEIFRYATMVNIIPKFDDIPNVNLEEVHYTIVMDKSGSMQGSDMENCKQGAKIFLLSLPMGASFDIYTFNHSFEKFKPVNELNKLADAIKWIEQITSNGGTELNAVLEDVYASIKQTGKKGTVLLLSDGGISDTNTVLKLVKQNNNVSMYTIGIGSSVSSDLIQGLADMGNGKAEFVGSNTTEVQAKIVCQLKRMQASLSKHHGDNKIQIIVDGPYKMVPEIIPTLYENDINTFYIFSENKPKSVTYTQLFDTYTLTSNIQINNLDGDESYPIHRIAGIKYIDNLNSNPIGSQIPHLARDTNKDSIIEASLNLGILSNYTAFVGVEVREEIDKTTQKCKLVEIPLQIAKKYGSLVGATGACGYTSNGQWGVNTVGSSFKNATYDLRGTATCPPYISNPFSNNYVNNSCNTSNVFMAQSSVNDLRSGNMPKINYSHNNFFESSSTNYSSKNESMFNVDKCLPSDVDDDWFDVKPVNPIIASLFIPNIKPINENILKNVIQNKIFNIILTIETLPACSMIGNLLTSDYAGLLQFSEKLDIEDYIKINDGKHNGIYKIWNLGSAYEKWVLEKVN